MQDHTAVSRSTKSRWPATQSDERETFESAFRHAAIGMALVSLSGHFLQVNDALCEIVGYSEARLLATTFQAITHPADLELDLAHIRELLDAKIESYQMEKRYIHHAGHEVPVLLSVSLVCQDDQPLYFISQIQDITERKRVEHSLQSLTGLLSALINNLHDGLIAEDMAGHITLVNRPICTLFGLAQQPSDLIGLPGCQAFAEISRLFVEAAEFSRRIEELRHSGRPVIDEVLELCDDRTVERDYTPIYGDSEQLGHLWVYRDVSERHRAQESIEAQALQLQETNAKLETLAATDDLTGIGNRRAFMEHVSDEVRRAARSGDALSLLMLDVDHFKSYNDSFGHPAGDEVLKTVAQLLQSNARVTDYVARYGGEEFAVILPQTDRNGALQLAERFRQVIESHPWSRRIVTVSAGVTTWSNADETPKPDLNDASTETTESAPSAENAPSPEELAAGLTEKLIAAADISLYRSKSTGRNRVSFEPMNADHSCEDAEGA